MADVIVDKIHEPLDTISEKNVNGGDTNHTKMDDATTEALAENLDVATGDTNPIVDGRKDSPNVKANGEDDASPNAHVESSDHAKESAHEADGALREEQLAHETRQQELSGPDTADLSEPVGDDINPYGLDSVSKGADESLPTGEVTTRVEPHPVVLEEVTPGPGPEGSQVQTLEEDKPAEPTRAEPAVEDEDPKRDVDDEAVQEAIIPPSKTTADTVDSTLAQVAPPSVVLEATEITKDEDGDAVIEKAVDESHVSEEEPEKEEALEKVSEQHEKALDEAGDKTEEQPQTSTFAEDKQASEEDATTVPITETETQLEVDASAASQPDVPKLEDTEPVVEQPTENEHEVEKEHEAEAGDSHVEPPVASVDHHGDPEVELTKDTAHTTLQDPSEPALQEASEAAVPPVSMMTEPEETLPKVEELEDAVANSDDLTVQQDASSNAVDDVVKREEPSESLASVEHQESKEVPKEDEEDVQEVAPPHAVPDVSDSAHEHDAKDVNVKKEDEELTHNNGDPAVDQPSEGGPVPTSLEVGEDTKAKEEEPSLEEKPEEVIANESVLELEATSKEKAAVPPAEDERELESAAEPASIIDDVQISNVQQEYKMEESEHPVDDAEVGPSSSAAETTTTEATETAGTAETLDSHDTVEPESAVTKIEAEDLTSPVDDASSLNVVEATKEEAEEAQRETEEAKQEAVEFMEEAEEAEEEDAWTKEKSEEVKKEAEIKEESEEVKEAAERAKEDIPLEESHQQKVESDQAPVVTQPSPDTPKELDDIDETHAEATTTISEPAGDGLTAAHEELGTAEVIQEAVEEAKVHEETIEATSTEAVGADVETENVLHEETEETEPVPAAAEAEVETTTKDQDPTISTTTDAVDADGASDEVRDDTAPVPTEPTSVEPEVEAETATKEDISDAPHVVADQLGEHTGEIDAVQGGDDSLEVVAPTTEVTQVEEESSTAPTRVDTEDDTQTIESKVEEPEVALVKEEEPGSVPAEPAEAILNEVQEDIAAANPETTPVVEEHDEEGEEAISADVTSEQPVPPETEVVPRTPAEEAQDAAAEPTSALIASSAEVPYEEPLPVEAVIPEAREDSELEDQGPSAQEASQDTIDEVNQELQAQPSAETKEWSSPEAELTASTETPLEHADSTDAPSSEVTAAVEPLDAPNATDNEGTLPPAAEIMSVLEEVSGPVSAEPLQSEEALENKENSSALEADSTTISEPVQEPTEKEKESEVAPRDTSLDDPAHSTLEDIVSEKVDDDTTLNATISESAAPAAEILDLASTSKSIESDSAAQVDDNTEDPVIATNEEAVKADDSQMALDAVPTLSEIEQGSTTQNIDPQRSESNELTEEAVIDVVGESEDDALAVASLGVEAVETNLASSEPVMDAGEPQISPPSEEQELEGQATETVKELVEGEKDVGALTAGFEETKPPEEDHRIAEVPADKDIAMQGSLNEADNELPTSLAPEAAGAEDSVVDEATGAVGDTVLSTTEQTGRLIVPETLELVPEDNTQITEETTSVEPEQPSPPAALEEPVPHASREDPSAGTHEQTSEFAREAGVAEQSVPEVTIELPTPSDEIFSYEDELITPDTEELPTVLEKDTPSVTTDPEPADQTRSIPTIVIPEVSKAIVERTDGETAAPKESTVLRNETPTAVHEIDEAARTPTAPLIEHPSLNVAAQNDDAIHMSSVENAGPADVTEVTAHETSTREDSAEDISSESEAADFDKHEAEHAESTPDSAHEYEQSETSVTIDVQEATADAGSSESLEDDKADIPQGSPRALSIDTTAQELPERQKSPWTPSYSVTQQGPGITQPPGEDDVRQKQVEIDDISGSEAEQENEIESEIEIDIEASGVTPAETEIPVADPDELQAADIRAQTPENHENHSEDESVTPKKAHGGLDTTPTKLDDIERPKSPYPPSYSVTQMGQGSSDAEGADPAESESAGEASMFDPLADNVSKKLSIMTARALEDEDGASSEAASNVPEVPMSPRSDLGIFTPGFDTRSEISVASHEPIAPSSPRIDPEEPIFPDSATRTPVGKVPARVDTADLALPADTSESITPLPASLVPLHGAYMTSHEVTEPEVPVAEETGDKPSQTSPEQGGTAGDDDDDKSSFVSESLSGLTTDAEADAISTDGRLTTIPPSEAPTDIDIESEVGSSAFDGDIESHRPASTADSMETDSWAQDTDAELASLPETDGDHAAHAAPTSEAVAVEAEAEAEHSSPDIVENADASLSLSEISESEAHESPVLVAAPKYARAPSEGEGGGEGDSSEFEAISNPGIATTQREFSDGMSELSTIRDDSTTAGPLEDMPSIPSSVSQLAIPEDDASGNGSGAPTPRPESPAAESALSLEYAYAESDFVSAARHTETELTTADEEDHTLMMPKLDAHRSADSETGSIEPLDDDTVRQHLSDASSSPAEPEIIVQAAEEPETQPTFRTSKRLPDLPVFPTIIPPSEASSSLSPKAFPGGLVALDEESTVSDFEPVSPSLGVRRRLESTASSLVFPGAWVVAPVPPERASLEIATGEFSRPPPGEFSRSNSGASPESTPLVTPTTDDEEKRRCVVM